MTLLLVESLPIMRINTGLKPCFPERDHDGAAILRASDGSVHGHPRPAWRRFGYADAAILSRSDGSGSVAKTE